MNNNTSSKTSTLTVKCPTCAKPVVWGPQSQARPFCSDRCRLIDLGEWANEEKVIAGEELPPTANSNSEDENW